MALVGLEKGILVKLSKSGRKQHMLRHIEDTDIGLVIDTPVGKYSRCYDILWTSGNRTRYVYRTEVKYADETQAKANKETFRKRTAIFKKTL